MNRTLIIGGTGTVGRQVLSQLSALGMQSSVAAFEVDHPATIPTKISRLRSLLEELPANVRFVEIDFDRQSGVILQ